MKKILILIGLICLFTFFGCHPYYNTNNYVPEPSQTWVPYVELKDTNGVTQEESYILFKGPLIEITDDYYISVPNVYDIKEGIVVFDPNRKLTEISYLNENIFSLGQEYLLYRDGLIWDKKYNVIRPYSDGFAAVMINDYDDSLPGGWGFIDTSANEVVKPEYEEVTDFKYGVAWVYKNNKAALIDKSGNILIKPIDTDHMPDIINENLLSINDTIIDYNGNVKASRVGSYGELSEDYIWLNSDALIDPQGNMLYQGKLSGRYLFGKNGYLPNVDNHIINNSRGDYLGISDINGNQILPPKYNRIGALSEGMAPVQDASTMKWGFVDETGKLVIECNYDEVMTYNIGSEGKNLTFHDGAVPISVEGKGCGYIDKTGKPITDPEFNNARIFSYGRAAVCKEDEWGKQLWFFIDSKGNTISEKYDEVTDFKNKIAAVCKNNKWGLIDENGKVVLELNYRLLIDNSEDYKGFVFDNASGNVNDTFYVISK